MTARIETLSAGAAATGDDDDAAQAEPLLDHAYDGIREYDNPLPGWWRATFWATIVFALGYAVYFHAGRWGKSPHERYEASLTDYLATRAFSGGGGAVIAASESSLARDSASDVVLDQGAKLFAAKCVGCHGPDGRGQIGPNLTDLHQLHGSSRLDVFNVVAQGVTGTAMIAWGQQLSALELNAVAAYAISLRGKNVAGGKPPQGPAVGAYPAVQ